MNRSLKLPALLFTVILFLSAPVLVAQTRLAPGASFELGFSPGGTAFDVVQKAIATAKHYILVAAYDFTSKPIADSLIAAAKYGIRVQVVADHKGSKSKYSQLSYLKENGVQVRTDAHYAIHHHKFMVIDGENVETGSFNYTKAADENNAENALFLLGVPQIAEIYSREWQRLWSESQ